MAISKEEQEYLVEQTESLTSKKPVFYLKFCSQEKFAEDVCNGKLYANIAEYFRKRELETENVLFMAPQGMFSVQFKSDDELPIVYIMNSIFLSLSTQFIFNVGWVDFLYSIPTKKARRAERQVQSMYEENNSQDKPVVVQKVSFLQSNRHITRTGACVILLRNVIVVSKKNSKELFKGMRSRLEVQKVS